MKLLLKIITVIIAIIIIILIAGVIALHFLLKPNNIKSMVIKQFYKQTGRQLVINKLDLSFFPTIAIQMNGVTIDNAKGFGNKPFAVLKEVSSGVQLMPLFRDKIITTGISVDGLSLNLMKNQKGLSNWQDFMPKQQGAVSIHHTKVAMQAVKSQQAQVKQPLSFHTPYIKLSNINIHYSDKQSGQDIQLNNVNFQANEVKNDKPFPFKLNINFTNQKPYTRVIANSNGQLMLAPQKNIFKIINTDLSASITNKSGNKKINIKQLNATIVTKDNSIAIKPLNAKLYGGRFDGQALIKTQAGSTSITSSGKMQSLQIHQLLNDLSPNANKITGSGNIQYQISTHGKKGTDFTKNLNGSGSLDFKNVQLLGIDLGYAYRSANYFLKTGKPLSEKHSNVTKFGHFTANYKINNGVINFTSINLTSPVLMINGGGTANLNTQKLNMRIATTGMRGSLGNLKPNGPTIPFDLTGSFNKPKFAPDLGQLLKNQLQNQIKKSIDKNLKHLNLNKLFGH